MGNEQAPARIPAATPAAIPAADSWVIPVYLQATMRAAAQQEMEHQAAIWKYSKKWVPMAADMEELDRQDMEHILAPWHRRNP